MKTLLEPRYYRGYRKTHVRRVIKLNTVNVIEITNGEFQSIRSFADNHRGNQMAKQVFKRCIKKNALGFHLNSTDLQAAAEDGFWQDDNDHRVFLTHSV